MIIILKGFSRSSTSSDFQDLNPQGILKIIILKEFIKVIPKIIILKVIFKIIILKGFFKVILKIILLKGFVRPFQL